MNGAPSRIDNGRRRSMASILRSLAIALVLIVPAVPAEAGEGMNTVRGALERAMKVLEDPALAGNAHMEERRKAVSAIAREVFDFDEMSRRALGAHWRERTPEERQTFVRLFTDLLETTYFAKIDTYTGGSTLRYEPETMQGDEAIVRTTITTTKGAEIPVGYRLLRKQDRWLIYDVDFGGVTLVSNYRAQFVQIIRSSSFEALVQRLAAKSPPKPAGAGS